MFKTQLLLRTKQTIFAVITACEVEGRIWWDPSSRTVPTINFHKGPHEKLETDVEAAPMNECLMHFINCDWYE